LTALPTQTVKSYFAAGSRCTVVRVTAGGFVPGLVRKVYAHDYEETWTGDPFAPAPWEQVLSYAQRTQANIVVNADGWSNSGTITGLQIKDGVLYHDFSDTPKGRHALGVLASGEFRIYDRDAGATADTVLADGVTDTFVWGPPLVVDGVSQNLEVQFPESEWSGPYSITSRTLLGQTSSGDTILIVVEGDRTWSPGLGGNDLVAIAVNEGCHQAIMLDGGGSTQLAVDGRILVESTDDPDRGVVSAIAISAVSADSRVSSGRIVVPASQVVIPTTVTMTSPYFSVIEVPGARLLSVKAAFKATSGALTDGQLLATFPPSCRGPSGSNWQYVLAHITTGTGSNGVGGIYYKTSSGELRISKDIAPAHAVGHRWDVTMLIDISPQTAY
jgi:hypothetical protein